MKIFLLSSGQDTGGQGYRIKRAFDRYAPDVQVRSMHASETFIRYPSDLKWDAALAQQLYDEADVVHHKNGLAMYERFQGDSRKPAIMHHQGTRLRDHPAEVNAEAKSVGAVQLVSTVDLLADVDDGTWLPSPYDLDWIRDKYRQPRDTKKIRIGHAPTNRKAKGTDEILKALDEVSRWFDNQVEVDLIEQVQWKVCLSRKGRCDIYIDQLTYGYGNNSIECFAMGVPVVSGWNDPADRARFVEQTGQEPPFAEADAGSLATVLEALIASEELREEIGRQGRAFAEQFHSEQAAVERLLPLYAGAPPTRGVRYLRRFTEQARSVKEQKPRNKRRVVAV